MEIGRSTFELAKHAKLVIGVEPWSSMRDFAVEKARSLSIHNVAFIGGVARELPFADNCADLVVTVFGFPFGYWFEGRRDLTERFVAESKRIVRAGGYVVSINGPTLEPPHELERLPQRQQLRPGHSEAPEAPTMEWPAEEQVGFEEYGEIEVDANYGSVQEAVETYGFIYGQKAIDWLLSNNLSSVRWQLRINSIRVS